MATLVEASSAELSPYSEKAKVQQQLIREFVKAQKKELDGKTKQLNHGKTGFRASTSCEIPQGMEPDIIKALRKRDMLECIVVKESVLREALKQYPEDVIKQVGARLKKSNTFFCEAAHQDLTK